MIPGWETPRWNRCYSQAFVCRPYPLRLFRLALAPASLFFFPLLGEGSHLSYTLDKNPVRLFHCSNH